MDLMEQTISP